MIVKFCKCNLLLLHTSQHATQRFKDQWAILLLNPNVELMKSPINKVKNWSALLAIRLDFGILVVDIDGLHCNVINIVASMVQQNKLGVGTFPEFNEMFQLLTEDILFLLRLVFEGSEDVVAVEEILYNLHESLEAGGLIEEYHIIRIVFIQIIWRQDVHQELVYVETLQFIFTGESMKILVDGISLVIKNSPQKNIPKVDGMRRTDDMLDTLLLLREPVIEHFGQLLDSQAST